MLVIVNGNPCYQLRSNGVEDRARKIKGTDFFRKNPRVRSALLPTYFGVVCLILPSRLLRSNPESDREGLPFRSRCLPSIGSSLFKTELKTVVASEFGSY